MIKISTIFLGLAMLLAPAMMVQAQETAAPATDEQQKEQAALEKKAMALLEQVIADAPSLKLPENRVRLQINAADLLWKRNEPRARTLFSQAAEGVAEMTRTADGKVNADRRNVGQPRSPAQLRQELVLAAARHDAQLAYQILASTRSLGPPAGGSTLGQGLSAEESLEQLLLARIASLDPKLALENAEQFLDKGQYPRTLTSVLYQLQQKDKDAANKLEDKLVRSLQASNMLASIDAGNLAIALLTSGPRPVSTSTSTSTEAVTATPTNSGQLLSQSSYQDLMQALVETALRATPAPAPQRGGGGGGGGGVRMRRPNGGGQQNNVQPTRSEAEIEQMNARRLLSGVQSLLPKIDQYLPDRAQAVRLKVGEAGMNGNRGLDMAQLMVAMQRGDANALETMASSAPAPMQNRIYQQAAMKALSEGDLTRARAIAEEHLEPSTRAMVSQAIDFRQMADKIEASRIEEVRQTLAGLSSDNQRIDLLLQLATAAQKKNPKMARQLLDEAQRLVNKPAANYQQMDAQIRVARGFASLDPARSFQVLEPGILQLNELLTAAAVLNGFEVNVFSDGELPLQASSALGNMVTRYAQELGTLAMIDFERTQTLVNRFQLPETRIQARLAIAQRVLRPEPVQGVDNNFVFGFGNFGGNFGGRQQRQ